MVSRSLIKLRVGSYVVHVTRHKRTSGTREHTLARMPHFDLAGLGTNIFQYIPPARSIGRTEETQCDRTSLNKVFLDGKTFCLS